MPGQISVSVEDMEDPVSIPNRRKHEVPEMVQYGKDAMKKERLQKRPKGERNHIQLQLKILLLMRMLLKMLLNKMVLMKELLYAEKVSRRLGQVYLPAQPRPPTPPEQLFN